MTGGIRCSFLLLDTVIQRVVLTWQSFIALLVGLTLDVLDRTNAYLLEVQVGLGKMESVGMEAVIVRDEP